MVDIGPVRVPMYDGTVRVPVGMADRGTLARVGVVVMTIVVAVTVLVCDCIMVVSVSVTLEEKKDNRHDKQ